MEESMRNRVLLVIVGLLISTLVWAQWTPSRNVDFIVTNSTGGGSDICARVVADIITKENMVPRPVMVRNWTDGSGEVARASVMRMAAGPVTDHTLLKFNADDTINMVTNTDRRVTDLVHLALIATDKHLFYAPKGSNLMTFQAVVDRIKGGGKVVVGGSRGTDPTIIDLLRSQMGWKEEQMPYVQSSSSGDAITQLLGRHLDLVISKPAAANPYVESGDLIPFLAFATERFSGNLANAPLLSELGYKNVEFPNWRTIAVAPTMSAAARAYWTSILERVTKTKLWTDDYIQKFQVIGVFMPSQQATSYIVNIQNDLLKLLGKAR